MTQDELNQLLKRNPALSIGDTRTTPKLERTTRDAALGESQAKAGDTARFLVRVTSIRKRLLDEDNLCPKYHVDCCRYSGILYNDSPDQTRIEVGQRKAAKGEEEVTIIEVFATTENRP